MDVATCEHKMAHECGADPSGVGIIDTCGGHADPYHYHEDLRCLDSLSGYDGSPGPGGAHSPALAVALDDRLVYGKFESCGREAAGGLDACNGHSGPVPADPALGVPASCTYHYHAVGEAPFTLGCFGPVVSLDQFRGLYEGCGTGFLNFTVWAPGGGSEEVSYDSWCPCYQHAADTGVCMSLAPGAGGAEEAEGGGRGGQDAEAGAGARGGVQADPPAPQVGGRAGLPLGSSALRKLRPSALAGVILAGTIGFGVALVSLRRYQRRQSATKQRGAGGLTEKVGGGRGDPAVQLQELRVA